VTNGLTHRRLHWSFQGSGARSQSSGHSWKVATSTPAASWLRCQSAPSHRPSCGTCQGAGGANTSRLGGLYAALQGVAEGESEEYSVQN